jgi:hypothetical protein
VIVQTLLQVKCHRACIRFFSLQRSCGLSFDTNTMIPLMLLLRLTQGEVKDVLVGVLQGVVQTHKDAKATVTDDEIAYYMSPDPARFGR